MLKAMSAAPRPLGIQNAEIARVLLDQAGIPVVGGDVGGGKGRKLLFRVSDGAAWVKLL